MNRERIRSALSSLHLLEPVRAVRRGLRRWTGEPPDLRQQLERQAAAASLIIEFQNEFIRVRRANHGIRISSDHIVYAWDMIRYFDYYYHAVVPFSDGSSIDVDYSHPRKQRLRQSGVEFEFPSLPESDESTQIYLDHLHLKEREVVLDLGAYAGSSSYFFSRRVGEGGRVAAFEPDPRNFESLERNLKLHSVANVFPFRKGIWGTNTTLAFQAEGSMGSSVASLLTRTSNVQTIEVVTLDEAARLAQVDRVHAIKMDIEGAEMEVLRGAEAFLKRHRPRMVIEPHVVDGKMCTQRLQQLLEGYGFSTRQIGQGSISDWPLVVAEPAGP
jgi:FkbM family methyltransferase